MADLARAAQEARQRALRARKRAEQAVVRAEKAELRLQAAARKRDRGKEAAAGREDGS
jgi:hypothetical protein